MLIFLKKTSKLAKMSYGNVPPPNYISKYHVGQGDGKRLNDAEKERMYNELNQNHPKSSSKANAEADNDYFEQNSSDEEEKSDRGRGMKKQPTKDEDEEDDELDAFMAEINKKATQEVNESKNKEQHLVTTGDYTGGQEGRDDIEQEDMQESMIKFMEEYKERQDEEEEIYEYDEDGNIVWTWKKEIDPLPKIDHSEIKYKPFNKNFYKEHDDVKNLTPEQTFELRLALDIRVYGRNPPKPVCSFAHFQFDRPIIAQIRKSEFEKPTPIQAQAVPVALSGRDCLGLAKTGSGKTLAYIWPTIVHIMNQTELSPGDGPIALIVVPTRELALQVYNEARKYAASYNIGTVCAYGGGSKYEQQKALEEGAELVIGTPGRIIDLVKIGATNLLRTTFLVFDEVDRMFDLGFEAQVKSIADHVRPDRQCLVFSATCKPKIEKLIIHALYDPIKILCGDIGEVNTDVHQKIIVLKDQEEKFNWLLANIVKFITMGKVLIFVTKKIESEDVAKKLQLRDIELVHLHGDMHQQERNSRITLFRTTKPVMVATDVAARGLDIPDIQNVLNFSVAKDIETHIHRVGRTGRAGHQGNAYTLITEKDAEFAAKLIKNLEASSQEQAITPELIEVANKCPWFAAQYEKQKQSNAVIINFDGSRGGTTFKPKERPGFGLKRPIGGGTSSETGHSFASTSSQPSISKQIERAKSLVDPGNAEMSKMAMMRSALKGTFKHSFQASSGGEFTSKIAASDPRPEWKIRLEEQAAKINKALQEQEEGNVKTAPPKKRSRWGEKS